MNLVWVLLGVGVALAVVAGAWLRLRRRSSRTRRVSAGRDRHSKLIGGVEEESLYRRQPAYQFDDDTDYLDDTDYYDDQWDGVSAARSVGGEESSRSGFTVAAQLGRWLSEDVPLGGRKSPLPRDGLFVRRNNAFGTRAVLGIKDLIDEGVLIDQAQIRFDDFVASDPSGIPLPPPGHALAVSSGSCPAQAGLRANENTTHFVEIALRAGEAGGSAAQSVPVNFVFVVDTSGSMAGGKIETVRTAIRELYAQLRDTDVLGIVAFDTTARTLLKATPKASLGQEKLDAIVAALRADGGTDINLGVLYGIDEISRHSRPDVVNCVYLFSDGEPNSGERDWIAIRRNIAAKARGELTLSCFGFGRDARLRELEALAGTTGGFCTLVTDPEDVRVTLAEDLARREHLAALNIQLQISLDATVTAWHLYGHDLITDVPTRARVERDVAAARERAREEFGVESLPDLVTQDEGIRIFAPDLAHGETYWVVLEVQAPADAVFGTATVQHVDLVAGGNRLQKLRLGADSTIAPETAFAHAVGLWTSEITFYALDDLYQNDRETANSRLAEHVETLRQAHAHTPAPQFRDDQVTFRKLMSLTANLGTVRAFSDTGDAVAVHVLNAFGQSRSGFARNRFG
ncbi:Secreted protein containing Ig-like domain and vWFA domain [Lentzea waywayandensis]|uniref:Secreted protein containing Ig-like domain and vWFA domain n=1 Tax=Lentzea waywayandensis TaxID=84724 RepID=A0A1I6FJE3_9PSEU|nr:VWA domain-containing protein [Lentzea waywayandensis]SFR30061.1 Secreted protein containing Ig-like domain and vWFA domain [Lentzea waywayandensis]